jgi:ketosteroid isomerase-like protein
MNLVTGSLPDKEHYPANRYSTDESQAASAVISFRTTMETPDFKQLVTDYIEAYNRFDVVGMLANLHDEVVFRNISGGEVNLTTTGKESFRQQAEQATHYFSQREQRVTKWNVSGNQIEVLIDYTAVAAIAFPNGLQPGDTLSMQGKSVFQVESGKIISIEDIS